MIESRVLYQIELILLAKDHNHSPFTNAIDQRINSPGIYLMTGYLFNLLID